MNDYEKRELIKLIVVSAIFLIILTVLLLNVDRIPEGVLSKKEEYTINYVRPTAMVEEVPKKLWEDPPVVKQVNLATPKPQLTESKEPEITYYGMMEMTAYVATGNPCADGVYPEVGWTVACNDPHLWHKTIFIKGYGTRYVHDTGGMASNVLDLFVSTESEAYEIGRRDVEVYIIDNE